MTENVLVTGGFGFLGRAVARELRRRGSTVTGIGHGEWPPEVASQHGFDAWHADEVSLAGLACVGGNYSQVVHCAGNSSVPYSLQEPLDAFRRTVESTAELLEHLRRRGDRPLVIYSSSAAVYGAADDRPLHESDRPNPVSPYGFHKTMAEHLCAAHAKAGWVRCVTIRMFSIYGPGLAKQLLWDAACKLAHDPAEATFWGTGEETRDWLHVDDAAALVAASTAVDKDFEVLNGASGERVTVSTVLHMLRDALDVRTRIRFNGIVKTGDPRYYHADTTRARALGWQPAVPLERGIEQYARWWRQHHAAHPGEASR